MPAGAFVASIALSIRNVQPHDMGTAVVSLKNSWKNLRRRVPGNNSVGSLNSIEFTVCKNGLNLHSHAVVIFCSRDAAEQAVAEGAASWRKATRLDYQPRFFCADFFEARENERLQQAISYAMKLPSAETVAGIVMDCDTCLSVYRVLDSHRLYTTSGILHKRVVMRNDTLATNPEDLRGPRQDRELVMFNAATRIKRAPGSADDSAETPMCEGNGRQIRRPRSRACRVIRRSLGN
jgi:hypothetical protein